MIGKYVLKQLVRDDRGTSAVEFGMLCIVVVVGIIAAISNLGGQNGSTWMAVFNKASDAIAAS